MRIYSYYRSPLDIEPHLTNGIPSGRVCLRIDDGKVPSFDAKELADALNGIVPGFVASYTAPEVRPELQEALEYAVRVIRNANGGRDFGLGVTSVLRCWIETDAEEEYVRSVLAQNDVESW